MMGDLVAPWRVFNATVPVILVNTNDQLFTKQAAEALVCLSSNTTVMVTVAILSKYLVSGLQTSARKTIWFLGKTIETSKHFILNEIINT